MRLSKLSAAVLAGALAACGMSEEEHNKAMNDQKAAFDEEMKKAQSAIAEKDEAMGKKDSMIQGLEGEVEKLGGDLQKVRTELGDRVTQLASTKTELAATTAELEQLKRLRAKAEAEAAQYKQLTERFKAMIDSGKLEVTKRKGRLMLNLPDDILFPSGSPALKKEGRAALQSVAEVLKDVTDREFLIAGHTDNIPVKRGGKFKNNWELSTARAATVVGLMIESGVPPNVLAAAGFAENDPIAENDTPENRAKNRRLEIILMPKIEDVGL